MRLHARAGLTLLCALLASYSVPAPAQAPAADPGAAVRAVGADYLAALTRESLFLQQKQGLPVDALPELTIAQAERRAATAATLLARLDAIPEAGLAEEDQLSRETLRRKLHFDAGAESAYWLGFEVTPYASPLGEVHQAFRVLPLRTKADADLFLNLLGQYPRFVGQIKARLQGQRQRGIRIPRDEVKVVKAYLGGAVAPGPGSPFAAEETRLSALAPADAAKFQKARVPLEAAARAALQALLDDATGPAADPGPEAVGLSQYPGGRAAYEQLVKLHTTLDVTPEEVHQIGLEEVARIEARRAEVRKTIGFTGTAAEFRESLRTNPRFVPKTADEVGQRLMAYITRIERRVDAFFLRKPKAPYGVLRLDAEREPGLTFGIYEPPSPTEPRGLYRYNGSKLEDRSLLTAGPLAYHELVPGHHFQIALASENEAIPPFRREIWDTAYVEGWGEYAAGLADEMGMYEDPYDVYGRLAMDMFLSVRLVVDTGMNALGWPRAKAVAFMREHLMESDTQIETESLRYSVDIPGQALAYKMGSRGIRDLRERARTALGPRFDIRAFHDVVLGSGSLPLSTLGRKVDAYVAREKATLEPVIRRK